MKNLIFMMLTLLFVVSCSDSVSIDDNPTWVNSKIAEFKSEPVGKPQQSIWRYTFNNQTVYYIPAQCCDQFSYLYDKDGDFICSPDGGFLGAGDGNCPTFLQERKNEKLIWKDSRKQ